MLLDHLDPGSRLGSRISRNTKHENSSLGAPNASPQPPHADLMASQRVACGAREPLRVAKSRSTHPRHDLSRTAIGLPIRPEGGARGLNVGIYQGP